VEVVFVRVEWGIVMIKLDVSRISRQLQTVEPVETPVTMPMFALRILVVLALVQTPLFMMIMELTAPPTAVMEHQQISRQLQTVEHVGMLVP
jgi:hypothetical protein